MLSREASQQEAVVDPWVTCFLTGMVIRHLDSLPEIGDRIDYHRVLRVTEGFDHIHDPKAFLLDPNNWVPHVVLRELIHRSEEASGRKDVTYRAALAYFASSDKREPTLMETIARYLDDVDTAVPCSGHQPIAITFACRHSPALTRRTPCTCWSGFYPRSIRESGTACWSRATS